MNYLIRRQNKMYIIVVYIEIFKVLLSSKLSKFVEFRSILPNLVPIKTPLRFHGRKLKMAKDVLKHIFLIKETLDIETLICVEF